MERNYYVIVDSRYFSLQDPPAVSFFEKDVLNEGNSKTQVDRAFTKQTVPALETNNYQHDRGFVSQRDSTTSEELAPQKLNLGGSSSEFISSWHEIWVAPNTEFDNKQECACTAEDKSVSFRNENAQLQQSLIVAKSGTNVGTKQRRNPEIVEKENVHEVDEKTDDNISRSSDNSLRDLALKLGYSESTFNTLSKLCPSEDKNSPLAGLLEEASSTFTYEKLYPEDSSCLRPIVIDGSDVAMRYAKLHYNDFSNELILIRCL